MRYGFGPTGTVAITDSEAVSITVTGINDAPVASTTTRYSGPFEDDATPRLFSFDATDEDSDNDASDLMYTISSQPSEGEVEVTGPNEFSFDVGTEGLSAGVEGFYGENKHETEGDKTNPYGAMGFLLYRAGNPESVGPYFYGGAGILVHKFSSDTTEGGSDTNFGYEFGAGLDFPFSENVGAWVEGRYMGSSDTTLFGIMAGLGFGVG